MGVGFSFPDDFIWGAATSSYQIEGGAHEDGKGTSIWDTFTHEPGRVAGDGTGDVAADHYHLWKEDIARMKWLGLKAYRFSIAWPRILPNGAGQVNEKGISFYNRLIDELLRNDIAPWVTLYHWDLPQALQDRFGGWQSRDCSLAFADYASIVVARFSDRVRSWFTTNELWNVVDAGYVLGMKAPGLTLPPEKAALVRHHALLGHGLAVDAIRQSSTQPCRIGFAEDLHAPIPFTESDEDIAAATMCMKRHLYAATMLEGRYPESYLRENASSLPSGWERDMPTIGSAVDFVGINSYSVCGYVQADPTQPDGIRLIAPCESHPTLGISWLQFDPDVLYWSTRLTHTAWNVKEIVISEGGCCSTTDHLDRDGRVNDTDRLMLMRSTLRGVQRATTEGLPLRGYFAWSLLDNFEWSEGYAKRFGLFYVNYENRERAAKRSAHWYRSTIANNGL